MTENFLKKSVKGKIVIWFWGQDYNMHAINLYSCARSAASR